MEIKSDTRNELFKRNEISFSLDSEKNPSFDEMKKQIVEKIKKPEENINVYNIKGNFGSKLFKVDVYVYDSKEDLKKAEQKTQKQRKKEAEEAKKAVEEAKKSTEEAAKPKEEAPAEEKLVEEAAPVEDETPVEDKPEEEKKEEKAEVQAIEESKE